MELEQFIKIGKCCVTDKPLSTSKDITMIQLDRKATWEFPAAGNVLIGAYGRAQCHRPRRLQLPAKLRRG